VTMASATPGFLRMCWPILVLYLKTLFVAAWALEYGDEDEAALLRLFGLSLPMVVVTMEEIGGVSQMQEIGELELFCVILARTHLAGIISRDGHRSRARVLEKGCTQEPE
jgi:hypothetical protein